MVPDGIVIGQAAISRTKLAPRTVCGNATLTMLPEGCIGTDRLRRPAAGRKSHPESMRCEQPSKCSMDAAMDEGRQ